MGGRKGFEPHLPDNHPSTAHRGGREAKDGVEPISRLRPHREWFGQDSNLRRAALQTAATTS
jgi:hypothetical protein